MYKKIKYFFFMWLLKVLPLRGQYRYKLIKMAGVKVLGPCWIYRNVYFDSVAPELVTIERGAVITQGTTILTHFLDPNSKGRHFRLGKVHIEEDAFIGVNTIICNSVTMGKGAVIGAGSVVTKDIPAYQVWAGNPACYIKDRAH